MNKLIRVLLVAFFVAAVSMTIANAAGRRVAASDVIQIHVLLTDRKAQLVTLRAFVMLAVITAASATFTAMVSVWPGP
jgi:hypothetical protein